MNARLMKIVGFVALGFLLALAAGWLWGASGRWTAQRRFADAEIRLRFTDARSRILAGRVDLYSLNFGSAAQNFDGARGVVTSLVASIQAADPQDGRIAVLNGALPELTSAQQLAAKMQQGAHAPAQRALDAVSAAAHQLP